MIRILSTFIAALMVLTTTVPGNADDKTTQIAENFNVLMKEVSCVVITDYAIRQINLFAYQMEQINPSNGERRKASIPMVAMAITMRMDMDARIKLLLSLGLEQSYIDGKLNEVTAPIFDLYSKGYISSTDYDKGGLFMERLYSDSAECEQWFRKQFKIEDKKPKQGNGGGING